MLDKDTLTLDAVEAAIRQDARRDAQDPTFRERVRQAAVVQLYAMMFNAAVTPPSLTTVTPRNANAERQKRWRNAQKDEATPTVTPVTPAAAQSVTPVTPATLVEPPEPSTVTPAAAQDAPAVTPALEPQVDLVTPPEVIADAQDPAPAATAPTPAPVFHPEQDQLPPHVRKRLNELKVSASLEPANEPESPEPTVEEPEPVIGGRRNLANRIFGR
jgi:hypothetical protein